MELSFQTLPMRYLGNPIQGSQTQEQTAEVIVPDSCPDVERVVFASASALLRGTECRAGSVLISGGIRASALCVPEDGTSPQKLDAYLPFSLRMEHTAIAERTQVLPELFVRQVDARQGERLGDRQAVRHDGAGCEGGESSGLRACGGGAAPADPDVRCKMVRPDFGQAARFSGKGKA